MSEVASLVPFGEFHSAWFYRDLFLRDETKYDKFLCPFCGIKIFAVLIYKPAEEELARSPHFRESEPHRHGCDGNPEKAGKASVPEGAVRKVEKQLFTLPTRLIEHIEPPQQARPANRIEGLTEPSPDEVKRRRADAGETHHRARFSVSLVQSLAEAHLGTIRQSYQLKDKKKWSDKQRSDWLKAVFRTEVDLRGATMRYDQAFHDLFFPVRSTPRVYHGEGNVSLTDEGYRIDTVRHGRVDEQDKQGMPFHVRVRADHGLASQRGARRELITQLGRAVEKGFRVKWYGYGHPEAVEQRFELCFDEENLTDLFVRRQPSKKVLSAHEGSAQSVRNQPDSDGPLAEIDADSGSDQKERTFETTHVGSKPDSSMRVTKSEADVRSPAMETSSRPGIRDGVLLTTRSLAPSVDVREAVVGSGDRVRGFVEQNAAIRSVRSTATKAELAVVSPKTMKLVDGTTGAAGAPSPNERAAVARPRATDSEARPHAWLAAVQKEYDAIALEQIAAAAEVVAAFRANTLVAHQQRKPLLWGRSAWKERLAELEAQDERNVAWWMRLQQRRLTPTEADSAMREAKRRARLNGTDDVTASEA